MEIEEFNTVPNKKKEEYEVMFFPQTPKRTKSKVELIIGELCTLNKRMASIEEQLKTRLNEIEVVSKRTENLLRDIYKILK